MPRRSRLSIAKPHIVEQFSNRGERIYSQGELATLFRDHRASWNLAASTNLRDFISFLTKEDILRPYSFRSQEYSREFIRYVRGRVPFLSVVQAINRRGYFCHGTAVTLHRLVKLDEKTIYLNAEQSKKASGEGSLSQAGIDRAFAGRQRQSKLIYKCEGASVVMISGKNTDALGVEEIKVGQTNRVRVTSLERTLVDIAVRPTYTGGPSNVLKAYQAARNRVSTEKVLGVLKKLGYVYPYHQAIGFLMQAAGYPETSYAPFKAMGLHYDFYLAHALKAPLHSAEWRLYYPKGLGEI